MIVARGAYDEGYVSVCPPCRHEYDIPVRSYVCQAVRSLRESGAFIEGRRLTLTTLLLSQPAPPNGGAFIEVNAAQAN